MTTTTPKLFCGERMKTLRKRKGISQERLAEIVGVSRTQIVNLELGNSEPSIATLIEIAVTLDTSTDFLLGVSEHRFPKQPQIDPLPFE